MALGRWRWPALGFVAAVLGLALALPAGVLGYWLVRGIAAGEAVRGLGAAARALDTPVVSGNVSLYNETSGRAIHPTPTIAMVGLLEDWERHAVSHFPEAGLAVVLLVPKEGSA